MTKTSVPLHRRPARVRRLPSNLPPRGLNFHQAAEYFGVSINTFKKLVQLGLVSPSIDLPGCRREIFDRLALDAAITSRSTKAAAEHATTEHAATSEPVSG